MVLPVDRTDVPMKDEIEATQSLGGQVLFAEHVGERRKSNVTFEKLQAYANIHGMPFDPMAKAIEEFLPDREAPKAADAADAAPAADAAAASTDAAAGTAPAAVPEPVMIEVTRVYLPLGLPVAPAVDPMAAPAAGAAPTEAAPVEPAPAPTGG